MMAIRISTQHVLRYRILNHLAHTATSALEADIAKEKSIIIFDPANIAAEISYLHEYKYISCYAGRYSITQAGIRYAEELKEYDKEPYEERLEKCIMHILTFSDPIIYDDICRTAIADHFDEHAVLSTLDRLERSKLVHGESIYWTITEKGAEYYRNKLEQHQDEAGGST